MKKSLAAGSVIIYCLLGNPVIAEDFGKYGDPRNPSTCSTARKYNALASMSPGAKKYGYIVESFMNHKYLTETGLTLTQAENHYKQWKSYIKNNCPDAW